jgi:hypothetical protein
MKPARASGLMVLLLAVGSLTLWFSVSLGWFGYDLLTSREPVAEIVLVLVEPALAISLVGGTVAAGFALAAALGACRQLPGRWRWLNVLWCTPLLGVAVAVVQH